LHRWLFAASKHDLRARGPSLMLSRFGTTVAFAVLAVIAILFLVTGHWILAILFAIAAAGAWFVRGVKSSTRR
jgi:predicted RND superfamily exporter protein